MCVPVVLKRTPAEDDQKLSVVLVSVNNRIISKTDMEQSRGQCQCGTGTARVAIIMVNVFWQQGHILGV